MLDFIPDTQELAQIFSNAMAPTFFLGAVAAFVSLMNSRLLTVIERIRTLNEILDEDQTRAHLKVDIERLRRRTRYLVSGIQLALAGGVCATLLLAIMFTTGFLGIKHAYGAGLLFIIATAFLGFSLIRFGQEARISVSEYDEYL
jgi:ABC-type Fe3+-siderophore transport system permease subunit